MAARPATRAGVEQVRFSAAEAGPLLGRALFEAAAGRLRPVVGRTCPLSEAARTHTAIDAREVLGRTLLTAG
ncbi:hypothetical protein ACF06W_14575 [Streptomyces albus]|uniref:hypothetical protein n=1 Tax=Streptomyces albus TaxID=1888 RepID=UPI0037022A6F